MEPGHEDREYRPSRRRGPDGRGASMEPGHEDREYHQPTNHTPPPDPASMEPGHEDREYLGHAIPEPVGLRRLNGARS